MNFNKIKSFKFKTKKHYLLLVTKKRFKFHNNKKHIVLLKFGDKE